MIGTRGVPLVALVGALVFGAHAGAAKAESPHEGESPHAHVSLVGLPEAQAVQTEIEGIGDLLRRRSFFDSSAASTEHPWTPCSVLAAGIMGVHLNAFWWPIERNGRTDPPPRDTNILGKFADKLMDGRIPRKEPGETGEILARLVLWRSGGINVQANTLFSGWTQKECLEALLRAGPEYVWKQMDRVRGTDTSLHLPPTRRWSATLDRSDTEKHLADLGAPGFLATMGTSAGNPLAPCSLLVAKRLGARLNDLWGEILRGRVEPPGSGDPFLKGFLNDLRTGAIPRDDPTTAAEIAARLVATRVVLANVISNMFASQSTQGQCLEEIFAPGSIRRRLIQEGKLPLR
jgi:hypothetical protein